MLKWLKKASKESNGPFGALHIKKTARYSPTSLTAGRWLDQRKGLKVNVYRSNLLHYAKL